MRLNITVLNRYVFTARNRGHKEIIDSICLYVEEQEVNTFLSQSNIITAQGV